MQDMRDLHRQGMISDDYMKELEDSMKQEQSLAQFEAHLDRVSDRPSQGFYRGSGGNKAAATKNQRKRKRKAQKKARRVCA